MARRQAPSPCHSQTRTVQYPHSTHHLKPLPSPVPQVLHVPQLDRTWGYAPPAASCPSSSPSPPPGHWPLLLLACTLSSVGALELLLRSGARADAANGYGLTALTALVHNDGMTPGEKMAAAKVGTWVWGAAGAAAAECQEMRANGRECGVIGCAGRAARYEAERDKGREGGCLAGCLIAAERHQSAWPLAPASKPPVAAPSLLAYGLRHGLQPHALRMYSLSASKRPSVPDFLAPAPLATPPPPQLLQRHGFSLWGAACELPQGAGQAANGNSNGTATASNGSGSGNGGVCERVTAATALLHGMALAGSPGEREAAGERWGWTRGEEGAVRCIKC